MTEAAAYVDSQEEDDAGDAEQYLTFIMDDEEYGIEILRVQGIQGLGKFTPMPNTPKYMLGVINLRGTVVPIVDLRGRFSLESIPFRPTTVVIVVKVNSDAKSRTVGLVADAVSDVYSIAENSIGSPPSFGESVNTKYVRGLATVNDRMVIILDVDQLLGDIGTNNCDNRDVAESDLS